MDEAIKEETISLRIAYGLKTPDAIIAATAIVRALPLMSGDQQLKRIKGNLDLIFVPFS